jgi:hypothetical protein
VTDELADMYEQAGLTVTAWDDSKTSRLVMFRATEPFVVDGITYIHPNFDSDSRAAALERRDPGLMFCLKCDEIAAPYVANYGTPRRTT